LGRRSEEIRKMNVFLYGRTSDPTTESDVDPSLHASHAGSRVRPHAGSVRGPRCLHSTPGLEQARIAARIAYDKATIGGVIDRLEQKGFIKRSISKSDRRAREVTLDFSTPGKPTDNAFIEAFNGRFRAECLNSHWFLSLRMQPKSWRLGVDTTMRNDRIVPSGTRSPQTL
jgi:transposase InsO family protein